MIRGPDRFVVYPSVDDVIQRYFGASCSCNAVLRWGPVSRLLGSAVLGGNVVDVLVVVASGGVGVKLSHPPLFSRD